MDVSANVSPDTEKVESLIREIRDRLKEKDENAVKVSMEKLGTESNPDFTMYILAKYLFLDDESNDDDLTSRDALLLVSHFASSDLKLYLKPASRAVKAAAVSLASTVAAGRPIAVADELLHTLVQQLSGDDVEVSSNAAESITVCCRSLGQPMAARSIEAIHEPWKKSLELLPTNRSLFSIISVRCASAIVNIAVLSDANMEIMISCSAAATLLNMVNDGSDALLQMSCLDLVEELAQTLPMHGNRARWLVSEIVPTLLKMAGSSSPDEEPDPILGAPALSLLASICRLGQRDSSLFGLGMPDVLTHFHTSLQKFEGSSELQKLAYIDAVSSFASASPDALELVLDDPATRGGWLSLSVAQPKLKSVVMTSIAMVIDPPLQFNASGDSSVSSNIPTNSMVLKLYSSIGLVNGRDATEIFLGMAKSAIVVLRIGAYSLLEAVAKRGTGSQMLLSYGGFLELLIHGEHETTKEGREAKYKIVEAVMNSEAKGLLADNVVSSLEKILQQGPHYVKVEQFDVMVE